MKQIIEYIKQAIAELKKVSWPEREEVKTSTSIVLVTVLIIELFLGVVDKIISEVIKMVIR